MPENPRKIPSRFAIVPAVIISVLAIYPQLTLWVTQGSAWQGSYYVSHYDETAYSAYVNALTSGRARLTDAFLSAPTIHESLYSVQFVPAYFAAASAKLFGGSTSISFIFLSLFCALLSSFAIFFLLRSITGDGMLSAVGVLVVLCLGTAVAFQGELRFWMTGNVLVDFFPFLRRYQPGFAFGMLFLFCGFIWKCFSAASAKVRIISSISSGITFAALVYSYFYLWTAAAAWLFITAVTFFLMVRESRKNVVIGSSIVGGFAIAALIPYFYLLSLRSPEMDSVQILALTRSLEIASPSMLIGIILSIVFVYFRRSATTTAYPAKVAIGLAFALTPIILFNQQLITGRSLQPVHYEIFVANYFVLVAAVILVSIFMDRSESEPKFRKALVYVGILSVGWGLVEASGSTGRSSVAAFLRDESVAAVKFANADSLSANIQADGRARTMLATNFITSDFIPTVSTLRPLWTPHTSSAGTIGVTENKRLFYAYLYFSGFTEKDLSEALKAKSFEVTAAIFGSERALPALGASDAISAAEVDAEVEIFRKYAAGLNVEQAYEPVIDYLLVPAKAEPSYANLEKWYRRDDGRLFGLFKLYRLTKKL